MATYKPPSSILIIGSGVFGLSSALTLASRPQYKDTTITVLDRSTFPAPDGSSIDSSRIIRADYCDDAYSKLAASAQHAWRQTGAEDLGGEGRYSESGLVLVAEEGRQGMEYVKGSFKNVGSAMEAAGDKHGVEELPSRAAIEKEAATGGGSGNWGYINRRSGWADATEAMIWLRRRVEATRRVIFLVGEAACLIYSSNQEVLGAKLKDDTEIHASLTILATGAWTSKLIDLRGRAQATGQVIAYLHITEEEQAKLQNIPVLLNITTGLFIIPPRDKVLKVARHAYGYANPVRIPHPEAGGRPAGQTEPEIEVSLPLTGVDVPDLRIPAEGEADLRRALKEMVPSLEGREFFNTRICWYTDTPRGDFLFDYHPAYKSTLFLATGGSGHGFKFLPVIGDNIVDCVEGKCPEAFASKWAWPENVVESVVTEDGSRGGVMGTVLREELAKGSCLIFHEEESVELSVGPGSST